MRYPSWAFKAFKDVNDIKVLSRRKNQSRSLKFRRFPELSLMTAALVTDVKSLAFFYFYIKRVFFYCIVCYFLDYSKDAIQN